MSRNGLIVAFAAFAIAATTASAQTTAVAVDARLDGLKKEAAAAIDSHAKMAQEMVDSVFSFGELGFQEFETSRYLTEILEKNGFTVDRGISGIPTAWVARWGSGHPVIALGSDIDGIPQASQKPGVAYHDPIIEGAPGHGEGHNSGMPLNILAALAVKDIMQREKLAGTLMLWPGVAEELVASKAWFVRDGLFKGVDICLFTHVGNNLEVSWGEGGNNGLVSIEYTFEGETAHSAAAPWRGRSALDAVELMDAGWNYRREHLRLTQRSHYVITNGGDQPNVVPRNASVWYYFRETDYPHIKELWEIGNKMAEGAALMTNTKWTSRILGTAWPQHMNKITAETMFENIKRVGLPTWSEADQTLARGIQKELGNARIEGLATKLAPLGTPVREEDKRGGGSDDVGDISWNVPTVTLRYPSNIPGLPGHNWANGISMATPIAHKGVIAGAKAQAMTVLDFVMRPDLVSEAWDYFNKVQTKEQKYIPFIAKDTPPPVWLNKAILEKYRPEMKKYYYDPTKYPTYLDQLGIKYPTVRTPSSPNDH
ncbi:MAG TPA: amidohydrolase [Vicinamibacterales bacterium]|nr:amidohydrolase [Vicinamibacterales bacterium]